MTKPWVALTGASTVVAIPAIGDDLLWDTIWKIGAPGPDDIARLSDQFLTRDGRAGLIRRVVDAGGWPVLVCHWQTLFSNGHETGLAVLDEVADRVSRGLGDAVRWMTCMEMARLTAGGPAL